jgi:hypothetical protein
MEFFHHRGDGMFARSLMRLSIVFAAIFPFAAYLPGADLTFFVGGAKPGSITYKNAKTALDSSPVFGVRLGTNFIPFLGMEHTLAFSSDFLYPRNISAIKDAKGFVYHSNLVVNVPGKTIVPFVTAGAGLIHQYGDSDMPVGTKLAFNYGGGVKFPRLLGPLGFRADLRGYRIGTISNKTNLFEISGGIIIPLGK